MGEGGPSHPVLVVEDNERNRRLARDLLEFRGIAALEAPDGTTALDLAALHRPCLVLMDVQLPDMDGVEALQRLRSDARTAAIPVVAVTAYAMKGDRERLLEAGFDGYIAKPIDVRTFVDELAPLMSRTVEWPPPP